MKLSKRTSGFFISKLEIGEDPPIGVVFSAINNVEREVIVFLHTVKVPLDWEYIDKRADENFKQDYYTIVKDGPINDKHKNIILKQLKENKYKGLLTSNTFI